MMNIQNFCIMYYPLHRKHFKDLDYILNNEPKHMLITYKSQIFEN